jgi:protein-L-isoaspartate(D-aspartate) O-methyltransferase
MNQKPTLDETLRRKLVEKLKTTGVLRDPRVEVAMLTVPRHTFAPWLTLESAYANEAYALPGAAHIPGASSKSPASTISQPAAVALMLEQADLNPGQNVLEIGAGSGYNAALISHIVGPRGHVVTLDIEGWIVASARTHLAAAGVTNVTVVLQDGGLGFAPNAPYDRIVATVGAWEIPPAWFDQLGPGGKIAAPVHLIGGPHDHDYLVLEREGNHLTGGSTTPLSMVLMRGGQGAHPETPDLTPAPSVQTQEPATIKALRVKIYRQDDPNAPAVRAFKRDGMHASAVLDKRWTRIEFEATLEPFTGLEA